jgi:dTDP-4-dehydrorhamnose 3,5-epimerase
MNRVGITIPGVVVKNMEPHEDGRGRFSEVMRAADFPESFVQSNHSFSRAGVLRGLHYHRYQSDLWYVVSGTARVGLVDLRHRKDRPDSATITLDEMNPQALYIPPGVAHGFYAARDVNLIYWVTQYHDGSDEHGIAWNDPAAAIEWGSIEPTLSDRDKHNPALQWDQIPSFS